MSFKLNFSKSYILLDDRMRSFCIARLREPLWGSLAIGLWSLMGSPVWLAGIGVELTNRCNLACAMCRYPFMKRSQGYMDLGLFKRIVDHSKEFKFPLQALAGCGEPLLYPHLKEALEYFQKNGFGLGIIYTNGLLLEDEIIEYLVRYAKFVRIAVDSADERIYKMLRRNDGYERLCGNVRKLIARSAGSSLKIQIQYLRTRLNLSESIRDFQKLFGEHKNVSYIMRPALQFGGGAPDLREVRRRCDVRNCWMPYSWFQICWNGDVRLCCFDFEAAQKIGNVRESNLLQVWHGARAKQLRKELRQGRFDNLPLCKTCPGTL